MDGGSTTGRRVIEDGGSPPDALVTDADDAPPVAEDALERDAKGGAEELDLFG